MVVHVAASGCPEDAPSVGFVVSKAVGNAVVRNKVKRRMRSLVAERLGTLPQGSLVVVRALPAAADAEYSRLSGDLDSCLRRSLSRTARSTS
jgi:ribonuclease P protein component